MLSDSDSDDRWLPGVLCTAHHLQLGKIILEESGNEATDTPLSSSPHIRSSQTKRLRISSKRVSSPSESAEDTDDDAVITGEDKPMKDVPALNDHDGEEDDEDNDVPVVRTAARRRVTSGFIIESSDEE